MVKNGEFRNLYRDRAARMVGNFTVIVSPYEILIHDNHQNPQPRAALPVS